MVWETAKTLVDDFTIQESMMGNAPFGEGLITGNIEPSLFEKLHTQGKVNMGWKFWYS